MRHQDQILALLKHQIGNQEEVEEIHKTAEEVAAKWVNPLSGGAEETNGLIYGLVQSGKTGVLTVTGAIGADEGYRTVLILTSDNDPLYEQTLDRAREAFPGMDILGKQDFRNVTEFLQRIKRSTCVIVATKNASRLGTLIDNFRQGRLKGLACLIIDDEADQASLNTKAKKADGTTSVINERLAELRGFFQKNTYLQVTATPQALFLQSPNHAFRPRFTVLSHPGKAYVGGDDFFGDGSTLVREFDLTHLATLSPGTQPQPTLSMPASLLRALDTFMVAATCKRMKEPDQNCAFLCHVSTNTADHAHIVDLLRKYKADLAEAAKGKSEKFKARIQAVQQDLAGTHAPVGKVDVDDLIRQIAFYSPGISVKLVNGQTDEDVAVKSPYSLFVGGNKLGRGVTIKNLLVSYYGRNPRNPQADTVLQHARMYGYRRKDLGLLRLFLPRQLHLVFRAIHRMEVGLRDLIEKSPAEEFRGLFVEGTLSPTRKSVLAPGSIGVYSAGSTYNPAQILRDASVGEKMKKIDKILNAVADKTYVEMPIDAIRELISLTVPDPEAAEMVWDSAAVAGCIGKYAAVSNQSNGYVYVARNRGLNATRRETQGVLDSGESSRVPSDRITLFMLKTTADGKRQEAWWPQIRFARGSYAFAFAI